MALCNCKLTLQVSGDLPISMEFLRASLHMFINKSGSGSPHMSALRVHHNFATNTMIACRVHGVLPDLVTPLAVG